MYWVRKAISILCGITYCGEYGKYYHKLLSGDRRHDPVYTYEGLKVILHNSPARRTYVVRSDNANHFKCAECFDDLQRLCNEDEINILRVYGIASHGKCEVDSMGGHLKNPIRKAIAQNVHIVNSNDCVAYLQLKYGQDMYTNPEYIIEVLEESILKDTRKKKGENKIRNNRGDSSFSCYVVPTKHGLFCCFKKIVHL